MNPIHFGTDGWRAVIAREFTFANVERVAQATADFWSRPGAIPTSARRRVVIGYDRRFLSDEFARATAEVFAGNRFEVILTPVPTPTPAVSYAVHQQKAAGGVVITASHNPPAFNGYKLKSHFGGPMDSASCSKVESLLDRRAVMRASSEGKAKGTTPGIELRDVRPAHLEALRRFVDFKRIARSGLRFAHDAMFGVGAGAFDDLLAGTRCRVTTLNGRHDPLFGGINPEPIPRNYEATSAFLRKHPHDFCLVTDGDADRIGGLDGRGRPLSTHQIICLLLDHFLVHRGARGRMIKALNTTSMVDRICDEAGIELVETGIGFKHITTEMFKGDFVLGAEESGSIGFPGHIPERDGLLAGMVLLELLAVRRKPVGRLIAELERRFGPHCYARLDTAFPVEEREQLMEFCRTHPPARLGRSSVTEIKTHDGVKYLAADGSWLMLRGSGTEPILRIYAETSTDAGVQRLIKQGVRLTHAARGV